MTFTIVATSLRNAFAFASGFRLFLKYCLMWYGQAVVGMRNVWCGADVSSCLAPHSVHRLVLSHASQPFSPKNNQTNARNALESTYHPGTCSGGGEFATCRNLCKACSDYNCAPAAFRSTHGHECSGCQLPVIPACVLSNPDWPISAFLCFARVRRTSITPRCLSPAGPGPGNSNSGQKTERAFGACVSAKRNGRPRPPFRTRKPVNERVISRSAISD